MKYHSGNFQNDLTNVMDILDKPYFRRFEILDGYSILQRPLIACFVYWMIYEIVSNPYSMVHGAHMVPIWGRQDPGGPHVSPMNFAIWEHTKLRAFKFDDAAAFVLKPSNVQPLSSPSK